MRLLAIAAAPNARTEQPALPAVPYLLAYEPGFVGFVPTEYVDIGTGLEAKRAALAAYRGLQAGVPLAEAFRFDASAGPAPTSRVLPLTRRSAACTVRALCSRSCHSRCSAPLGSMFTERFARAPGRRAGVGCIHAGNAT